MKIFILGYLIISLIIFKIYLKIIKVKNSDSTNNNTNDTTLKNNNISIISSNINNTQLLANNSLFEVCPSGAYLNDKKLCTPCAPGSYSFENNSNSCTLCPAGTYSPTAGAISCIKCANSQEGAATCL